MRRNSGFTAFELAVSMAIMVIVASLVLPPYLKWLRNQRLSGATTNLMADLEMAKIRAIRENAFVVVLFNQDSYTIFVDNGQPAGTANDWDPSGEDTIRNRTLPSGVQIDLGALTLANNRTRFNSRGLPDGTTTAETIPLVTAENSKMINLNRLGRLSVQ